MRFSPLVLVTLLATTPGLVRGQEIPSPYRFIETRQEAGLFAGTLSQGRGRFGFGPGSGPVFGVRYEIGISGPFAIEGVGSYIQTTRDVIDPRRDEGDRIVGEADARLASVDARLKFSLTGERTWNNLSPTVIAGGGVVFGVDGLQPEDDQLGGDDKFDFGTSFLGVVGGGGRWFLTERFLVRAEVLMNFWKIDTPRGYLDTTRGFGSVAQDEWVSGFSFTAGTSLRF